MTSLVIWAAVDSHGPTSLYMCSDSRISWQDGGGWNHGRKVFASRSASQLFGYCGDVVFPSLLLAQVVDLIDARLINGSQDPLTWSDKMSCLARSALMSYPIARREPFTIVHCLRTGENMSARFFAFQYRWDGLDWSNSPLAIPTERSGIVAAHGTGTSAVVKWHNRWNNTPQKRTSRAVFGAFCDSLNSQEDMQSDGPPQLVALHRSFHAKTYGIIWKGDRYLLGLPVGEGVDFGGVDWRNALFERCDGKTMSVLPDAQQHRQPRGLALALKPAQDQPPRKRQEAIE